MRKPWMKELQSMRFSRDGLMTVETARWQREANSKTAHCVWLSRQIDGLPEYLQRKALGEQWEQNLQRCGFTTYAKAMEVSQ